VGLSCNLRNNGISLLELVITIAILSLGIIVILQAFAFSTRATGLSCDIINAVFLAEDKVQELEFKEKQNLINEEPTQLRDTKDKFIWEYSLNNLAPDLNLYKLNLSISWQKLNREERISLSTYLR